MLKIVRLQMSSCVANSGSFVLVTSKSCCQSRSTDGSYLCWVAIAGQNIYMCTFFGSVPAAVSDGRLVKNNALFQAMSNVRTLR